MQINGKTKDVIEINENYSKEKIIKIVMNNIKIKKNLNNRKIINEIYVPGKILNLVV